MDDIVVRLNTQDADVTSNDRKEYIFYLNNAIILNDEYDLNVSELVCRDVLPPSQNTIQLSDVSLFIYTNFGFDLGNEGIFKFEDVNKRGVFIIEIFTPPGFGSKRARINSIDNMSNYNVGDIITVPSSGANAPQPTDDNLNVTYYKSVQSGDLRISIDSISGTTDYSEIALNIRLDYVKFKNINYLNTSRIYTPVIASHNPLDKKGLVQKYPTLHLVPQIIQSFKLIIDNEYYLGLPANGIVNIAFILQKKSML